MIIDNSMVGSFKFNNTESSTYGLICKSVKRPLLPAAKVRRIETENSSGAYDVDDESVDYGLRQLTMKIQYIGTSYEELRTSARSIAAWLSCRTWAPLQIHDEDDKYYLAKVTDAIDLNTLWESGSADVVFDCQPFAYSITEVTATGVGDVTFTHPGTREINYKSPPGSKFLITVNDSWSNLSFTLNGRTLTYSEAGSGLLIIDNIKMEVTLDGVNKFYALEDDYDTFLEIKPGVNTLNVVGATATVEFIPMWY